MVRKWHRDVEGKHNLDPGTWLTVETMRLTQCPE